MVHKRIRRFVRRARTRAVRGQTSRRRITTRVVSRVAQRVRKVSARRAAAGIPSTGAIIGAVTPVGKAATIGKGVVTGVRTFASRVLGNPLAGSATIGAGLKAFGKRAGGRALGLGIGIETFQFGRAKATGKPFDPIPDLGLVASAALNPIATIGGLIFGGGERAVTAGTEVAKELLQKQPTADFFPLDFQQGDINITFPEGGTQQDFSPGVPQPPIGAFFPSIDLQVGKVGGGQNELLRLLILLLGAGGLGALLGKRSKKKKKKKTKKSKKDDDDD